MRKKALVKGPLPLISFRQSYSSYSYDSNATDAGCRRFISVVNHNFSHILSTMLVLLCVLKHPSQPANAVEYHTNPTSRSQRRRRWLPTRAPPTSSTCAAVENANHYSTLGPADPCFLLLQHEHPSNPLWAGLASGSCPNSGSLLFKSITSRIRPSRIETSRITF